MGSKSILYTQKTPHLREASPKALVRITPLCCCMLHCSPDSYWAVRRQKKIVPRKVEDFRDENWGIGPSFSVQILQSVLFYQVASTKLIIQIRSQCLHWRQGRLWRSNSPFVEDVGGQVCHSPTPKLRHEERRFVRPTLEAALLRRYSNIRLAVVSVDDGIVSDRQECFYHHHSSAS